ncbi:MAG TPA: hypothetical protein VIA45_11550 [Thermoanaerobaculia bacterium]|jgi:hypothetical protein
MSSPDTEISRALPRVGRRALAIGLIALAACAAGAFLAPEQFFRSYLFAWVFWTGMTLGCLSIVMLHYLTGGAWGIPIRRPLESGMGTLPLMAILFVPLLFGLRRLYEWARPEEVAHDPILQHKAAYLNSPFAIGRVILYFGSWFLFAYLLDRWSLRQDRDGASAALARRMQMLSAAGLVMYGLTVTFWSIDWVMSLEPHWISTMYGVLYISGHALAAMAFVIVVTVALAKRPPLAEFVSGEHWHDLAKLTFAFLMFWAYVSFSQYLIIWAGNLPEEIPWYLRRLQGGWGWIGAALVFVQFFIPFLLLLSADRNRNTRLLWKVALLLVVMQMIDVFWLVRPAASHGRLDLHWLDFLAPVGIGGVWIAFFLRRLGERPLLPRNDPEFLAAVEHGRH